MADPSYKNSGSGFDTVEKVLERPEHSANQSPNQPVEEENSEPAGDFEEGDDVHYLTGKPFFDVTLTKSHVVRPFQLALPVKITRELPRARIPATLRHNRKNWEMEYVGNSTRPRFSPMWKFFVADNNPKIGDSCVFELLKCSTTEIKFKVHILRFYIPPALQARIDSIGTERNPLAID